MENNEKPFVVLKGKIIEGGLNYRKLAPLIGLSPKTLSRKINNKSDFSCEEIERICDALNIEPKDVGKYFFETKREPRYLLRKKTRPITA